MCPQEHAVKFTGCRWGRNHGPCEGAGHTIGWCDTNYGRCGWSMGAAEESLKCKSSLIRDEVKKAIADGSKRIVLNLGEISYIDSGGLGTLVALHTTAHNTGGTIKLANLTRRVGDLLQVTKLLTVFEVHDSEYDALEAFRTAA
ncbi:MAG: hypothetical protein DMG78_17595 [Acidobacteria bacterium]|nr:MAG: hypothetical protein DMG78_17595 [Acidobacteriota bacterium]